ncbi:MAG: hypothetical protein E6J00_01295 [Chloroflexi bacterium]|nr:MAG: hypothetical protein E6J00_01295 [Chloroflexota bacterium]
MDTRTHGPTIATLAAPGLRPRFLRSVGILISAASLFIGAPIVALAGGNPAQPTSDRQLAPTLSSQLATLTPAQLKIYKVKVASHSTPTATSPRIANCPFTGGPTIAAAPGTASCSYGPRTSVWMNQQQEGNNNTWCGPATISMMYSHWSITVTQAQAASDMGTNADGTSRGPMQTEANRYQSHNPYVWQNVGPGGGGTVNDSGPTDLYNYAADDIANWNAPVGYNVETYAYYHGHPLWHYPTQDYKHYFPGYAYDYNNNLGVQDDFYGGEQDWYYYKNLWMAVDDMTTKFGGYGGFIPNQILW